ncbi:hypothetical protein Droror1_Dr00006477 [Drosera rotundifolia]
MSSLSPVQTHPSTRIHSKIIRTLTPKFPKSPKSIQSNFISLSDKSFSFSLIISQRHIHQSINPHLLAHQLDPTQLKNPLQFPPFFVLVLSVLCTTLFVVSHLAIFSWSFGRKPMWLIVLLGGF